MLNFTLIAHIAMTICACCLVLTLYILWFIDKIFPDGNFGARRGQSCNSTSKIYIWLKNNMFSAGLLVFKFYSKVDTNIDVVGINFFWLIVQWLISTPVYDLFIVKTSVTWYVCICAKI